MILGIISLDASRRNSLVFEYVVILEFKSPRKVDHNIVKWLRNGFPAVKTSSVMFKHFCFHSLCIWYPNMHRLHEGLCLKSVSRVVVGCVCVSLCVREKEIKKLNGSIQSNFLAVYMGKTRLGMRESLYPQLTAHSQSKAVAWSHPPTAPSR